MLYRILLALLLLTQLPVAGARDLSAPYRSEMVTIWPGLENFQLASGKKALTAMTFSKSIMTGNWSGRARCV